MEPQIGIVQPQATDLGQDELAAVEKLPATLLREAFSGRV